MRNGLGRLAAIEGPEEGLGIPRGQLLAREEPRVYQRKVDHHVAIGPPGQVPGGPVDSARGDWVVIVGPAADDKRVGSGQRRETLLWVIAPHGEAQRGRACVGSAQEVRESAVVARPDEKWDERPVAFVVRGPGNDGLTEAQVVDFLTDKFAKWQLPSTDDIRFVEEIPRTSVGKFDKKILRELF